MLICFLGAIVANYVLVVPCVVRPVRIAPPAPVPCPALWESARKAPLCCLHATPDAVPAPRRAKLRSHCDSTTARTCFAGPCGPISTVIRARIRQAGATATQTLTQIRSESRAHRRIVPPRCGQGRATESGAHSSMNACQLASRLRTDAKFSVLASQSALAQNQRSSHNSSSTPFS